MSCSQLILAVCICWGRLANPPKFPPNST